MCVVTLLRNPRISDFHFGKQCKGLENGYHQPSTRIWNEIEKKAAFNLEFQAISDAEDQSRALLHC